MTLNKEVEDIFIAWRDATHVTRRGAAAIACQKLRSLFKPLFTTATVAGRTDPFDCVTASGICSVNDLEQRRNDRGQALTRLLTDKSLQLMVQNKRVDTLESAVRGALHSIREGVDTDALYQGLAERSMVEVLPPSLEERVVSVLRRYNVTGPVINEVTKEMERK